MKILTVVGARPQFIKAAPVSLHIRKSHREVLVHTGQHYDDNMSAVFFEELQIPRPDYSLGVGSGGHGEQTGKMLQKLEEVLRTEQPHWVMVYGDTNSTLAGSLAAAKMHIPVLHIEAGLRSHNRRMPEEINRVMTDHLSTVLACPTKTAVDNLGREGFSHVYGGGGLMPLNGGALWGEKAPAAEDPLVVNIGDVMYDALLHYKALAGSQKEPPRDEPYILATVHRAENTDDAGNLKGILTGLAQLQYPVILPLHPRTRGKIREYGLEGLLSPAGRVQAVAPVGYLDMLQLTGGAQLVVTDSGGLQKEAFLLDVPCITLRDETEWVETVQAGWNVLAGLGGQRLLDVQDFWPSKEGKPAPYGDGRASWRLTEIFSQSQL